MTRIVAFESVTLDGVMQAPGRPDEDTRGGFERGGWAAKYADEESGKLAAEGMANTEALLLGRRTYEDLLESWNKQGGPFKDMLNSSPKYVASRKLETPCRGRTRRSSRAMRTMRSRSSARSRVRTSSSLAAAS